VAEGKKRDHLKKITITNIEGEKQTVWVKRDKAGKGEAGGKAKPEPKGKGKGEEPKPKASQPGKASSTGSMSRAGQGSAKGSGVGKPGKGGWKPAEAKNNQPSSTKGSKKASQQGNSSSPPTPGPGGNPQPPPHVPSSTEYTVHLLPDGRADVRLGGQHVATAPNRRIARRLAESSAQQKGYTVDPGVHLELDTSRALHKKVVSGQYIVLDPHTIYRIGSNATYHTDAHGRVAEANFQIERSAIVAKRQAQSERTSEIGKLGRDQGHEDVGFHIGSDKAGFIDLYPNIVPGDKDLNGTIFKSFEKKLWKPAQVHGTTADVRVRLHYDPSVDPKDASNLGNLRPTKFEVEAVYGNGFGVHKLFPNSPVSKDARALWYNVSNELMKHELNL
jgi:hypothetical protein